MSKEEIYKQIAEHQEVIEELTELYNKINDSVTENIRITIQTKHWYGYGEPFIKKCKSKLDTEKKQ